MTTEGSVVRVDAGSKLGRPGVVLRLVERDGARLAFVLWGTGTHRPERAHVAVNHREQAGVILGLEKPTYFYATNVWMGRVEKLNELGRVCPVGLLIRLRKLVGM